MIRSLVVLVTSAVVTCALSAQAAPTTAAPRGPSAMPPADSTAPHRKPPRSWTSDRRDFAVGDIITILVDENTAASAQKANTATDRKSRKMDFDATLPAPAAGKNAGIESSNNGESRQDGQATRGNHFVGDIAVKVVAIGKEGNLQIKGSKTVDVDKNKQVMTLSGWLRPQDVSTTDVAASSRVADAQLVYTVQGSLGKTRSGILTRVLGVLWP